MYKVFIVVYECKNISRAAKELIMGQPNVSRSIKELEKQLDVKLFYTNPRGVEPTSDAVELYNFIVPAFTWLSYGESNFGNFNERSKGIIRIICTTSSAGYFLAKHIENFNKKYPYVQFDIKNKDSEEALEELARRNTDLVIAALPLYKNNFKFESIAFQNLTEVFFCSVEFAEKHNLGEVVTRKQFDTLPRISIRVFEPEKKPTAIVDNQEMQFQLVRQGLGVGRCLEQFLDYSHPSTPVFKFLVEGIEMLKPTLNCVYNSDFLIRSANKFLEELLKSSC